MSRAQHEQLLNRLLENDAEIRSLTPSARARWFRRVHARAISQLATLHRECGPVQYIEPAVSAARAIVSNSHPGVLSAVHPALTALDYYGWAQQDTSSPQGATIAAALALRSSLSKYAQGAPAGALAAAMRSIAVSGQALLPGSPPDTGARMSRDVIVKFLLEELDTGKL